MPPSINSYPRTEKAFKCFVSLRIPALPVKDAGPKGGEEREPSTQVLRSRFLRIEHWGALLAASSVNGGYLLVLPNAGRHLLQVLEKLVVGERLVKIGQETDSPSLFSEFWRAVRGD